MFVYPKDLHKEIRGNNFYAMHPGMLHLYKNSIKSNPSPTASVYDANN